MSIRTYKPTTPSRRNMTNTTFEEITTSTPEKSLLIKKTKVNRQHETMASNKPAVNIFGSLIVTTRFVPIALVDCSMHVIVCKQICFV